MPSPAWSEKSRRVRLGRVELIIGRAISAMVRKVAPFPPQPEKLRRVRLEDELFLAIIKKVGSETEPCGTQ